jgi:hypothetical protein
VRRWGGWLAGTPSGQKWEFSTAHPSAPAARPAAPTPARIPQSRGCHSRVWVFESGPWRARCVVCTFFAYSKGINNTDYFYCFCYYYYNCYYYTTNGRVRGILVQ